MEIVNSTTKDTESKRDDNGHLSKIIGDRPPFQVDWEMQLQVLYEEFEEKAKEIIKRCGPIEHLANPLGTAGMNGFAHSNNIAHWMNIRFNNFFHRSETEVSLHAAFLNMNLKIYFERGIEHCFVFSPLPVFVSVNDQQRANPTSRKRIETDFFVITQNGAFVVEVDGDSHREKTHEEEESRLRPFRYLGVEVWRIKPDPSDPEWADREVVKFLKFASVRGRRI